MTQGALAEALGVATSYVSDVERGYRAPWGPQRVMMAAGVLGVPWGPLLSAREQWGGQVEVPLSGDARRDAVLHALARQWADLSPDRVEAVAELLGGIS